MENDLLQTVFVFLLLGLAVLAVAMYLLGRWTTPKDKGRSKTKRNQNVLSKQDRLRNDSWKK